MPTVKEISPERTVLVGEFSSAQQVELPETVDDIQSYIFESEKFGEYVNKFSPSVEMRVHLNLVPDAGEVDIGPGWAEESFVMPQVTGILIEIAVLWIGCEDDTMGHP